MLDSKQIEPGQEGQVVGTNDGQTGWTNIGLATVNKSTSPAPTDGDAWPTQLTLQKSPKATGFVVPVVNGVVAELGDGVRTKDGFFTNTPPFRIIAMARYSSGVIRADGTAWGWGNNSNGALGDNSITNRSSPVSAVGGHVFVATESHGSDRFALKRDGTLWAWGFNGYGRLADNSIANRSSPVSAVGAHSFAKIARHGLGAIKADGSAWRWSVNNFGQIGDNSITYRSSPVSVVGAHSFTMLAANANFNSMALKADGGAWTWGYNSIGQLGDGTTTNRSSPVSVVGSHSFIQIGMGDALFAGLKYDGSVWAWGSGGSGRLGDNSTTNKTSPVSVVGAHSFIRINSNEEHTVALKADGSVWAWGLNTFGQLGDNSTANRSSPVSVVGAHSFIDIISGGYHSMAVKNDGSIWTWGNGATGQLGNEAATNRSSPVSVVTGGIPVVRTFGACAFGDHFIWNGRIAQHELGTSDRVDFNFI